MPFRTGGAAGAKTLSELEFDPIADAAAALEDEDTAEAALRTGAIGEPYMSDVFENTNLSVAKINDIITHDNIEDSGAQQIVGNTDPGTRDLTDADSIYELLDDWEDNNLLSRQDAETTPTDFTNLFAQLGHFRPRWTKESGSPSANGGVLVLTAGDATIQAVGLDTTFFVGTWETDMQKQGDGTTGTPLIPRFRSGGANKYGLQWVYDDTFRLYDDVDNANVISATHAEDTDWHTGKVTRDSDGNWEIFWEGASDGTGTDTTTTSIDEIWIENDEDIEVHYDNFKVH